MGASFQPKIGKKVAYTKGFFIEGVADIWGPPSFKGPSPPAWQTWHFGGIVRICWDFVEISPVLNTEGGVTTPDFGRI